MKQAVEFLGNKACIEGLKKAILATRKYHGYNFIFFRMFRDYRKHTKWWK